MRRDLVQDIERVELQILRLLAVRDGLIDLLMSTQDQPGEAANFVAATPERCARLALEHDLDPHQGAFPSPGPGPLPPGDQRPGRQSVPPRARTGSQTRAPTQRSFTA